MKTNLIRIGNSKGIRIPKSLIEQYQLTGEIELISSGTGLLITSSQKPRSRWEDLFRTSITGAKEKDGDVWKRISNKFDNEDWSW
jgi:antitoxin MazE